MKLGARLTEVGTLETWCDSKVSDHRWRLQFELRKTAAAEASRPSAVVSEEHLLKACAMVSDVFAVSGATPFIPEELPSRLEQTLGLGRNSWPIGAIRQLADAFLAAANGRKKSPAFEARWLNLCGFCLRPALVFRVTITALNKRGACTRAACNIAIRFSVRSIGGSSPGVSRAG